MSAHPWDRISRLFEEALERPEGQRAAFLDEVCAQDPELRREVESLLQADREAGRFLEDSLL